MDLWPTFAYDQWVRKILTSIRRRGLWINHWTRTEPPKNIWHCCRPLVEILWRQDNGMENIGHARAYVRAFYKRLLKAHFTISFSNDGSAWQKHCNDRVKWISIGIKLIYFSFRSNTSLILQDATCRGASSVCWCGQTDVKTVICRAFVMQAIVRECRVR